MSIQSVVPWLSNGYEATVLWGYHGVDIANSATGGFSVDVTTMGFAAMGYQWDPHHLGIQLGYNGDSYDGDVMTMKHGQPRR